MQKSVTKPEIGVLEDNTAPSRYQGNKASN
jgi:hypothetical protein